MRKSDLSPYFITWKSRETCFEATANKISDSGIKTIYMQIISPSGEIFGENKDAVIELNDQSLFYPTTNSSIKYLNEKLAACVNVIPGVQSIFRWQDKIDNANENILIIKTKDSLYDELEVRIKELHPYELPEIISVPIDKGLNKYLDWISESTK